MLRCSRCRHVKLVYHRESHGNAQQARCLCKVIYRHNRTPLPQRRIFLRPKGCRTQDNSSNSVNLPQVLLQSPCKTCLNRRLRKHSPPAQVPLLNKALPKLKMPRNNRRRHRTKALLPKLAVKRSRVVLRDPQTCHNSNSRKQVKSLFKT